MNQDQASANQILHAQAFQIAVQLKGPVPVAEGNDYMVEAALETYRPLANSIYRFLGGQRG
jgi:hypothetical protein